MLRITRTEMEWSGDFPLPIPEYVFKGIPFAAPPVGNCVENSALRKLESVRACLELCQLPCSAFQAKIPQAFYAKGMARRPSSHG